MHTGFSDTFEQAKLELRRDNWREAEVLCRALLDSSPAHYDALNLLGSIAAQSRRPEEAVKCFTEAARNCPDRIEALGNLGNVLQDLNRHEEALAYFDRALELDCVNAQLHCNRGIVLCNLGRRGEGAKCYQMALQFNPRHPEARWNLALLQLQMGRMAEGWPGHELRWEVTRHPGSKPQFPQPMWRGKESVSGKTILLHAEAGLGDTLQFCRYAELLARMGAQTIVAVPQTLIPVVKNAPGVHQIMVLGESPPPFDCHCPMMSLPYALKTDLATIPASVPYLFSEPSRLALWRSHLGPKSRPRVGLVWSGNPGHKNDHNRSISIATLQPLLENEAIEWCSLQKEIRGHDMAWLSSSPGIRHFGGYLHDFADTAALVQLMDIVITVDSGVAHLAGAMGRPVWILLPFNPDWRWLLDREDSPWYPSARLFRQTAAGDWASVIELAQESLTQWCKSTTPASHLRSYLPYLFAMATLLAVSTYLLLK